MTKFLTALVLATLSQQTLATTVAAGIEFLDVGTLKTDSTTSVDANFLTNYKTPDKTKAYSGADGNAATFVYGANGSEGALTTFLGLSLSSAPDVADVNLTLLLVGSNLHSGTVDLLGGSTDPDPVFFSLLPYNGSTFTGYTGFNSVAASPPAPPPADDEGSAPVDNEDPPSPPIGIFALTINLADKFGDGFGTFDGVQLQIYGEGYDAAPSLVGTTAVIPVPAAVWLFGSGLLGLVGVARRKK
jgi:hypothetical protein